jgi:hypothetical protein
MLNFNHKLILISLVSLTFPCTAWSFTLPTQVPDMNAMTGAVQQIACTLNTSTTKQATNASANKSDNQLNTPRTSVETTATNN